MAWPYVLTGAVLLGAYAFVYYLRIKRTRRVDEYIEDSIRPAAPTEDGVQIPGATRDMVQHSGEDDLSDEK